MAIAHPTVAGDDSDSSGFMMVDSSEEEDSPSAAGESYFYRTTPSAGSSKRNGMFAWRCCKVQVSVAELLLMYIKMIVMRP